MTSVALPVAGGRPLWRIAQGAGVLLTVVLLVALWIRPAVALHVLWDMVIPLLPAVFLVNPHLWRNACPLATLNDGASRWAVRSQIDPAVTRAGWVVGLGLLFVLVPARRFLFNEGGPALALTIVVVAIIALVGGFQVSRRAGFCSSICPVLPVEKLYGQSPLVSLAQVRCVACTVCTPIGCIDLAGPKTIAQTIGPLRRDTGWIRTAFGAFAAAFPGFIIAYFTTENGPLSAAPAVYARVAGFSLASYAAVAAVVAAFRLRAAVAVPVLGACALGLYYWYSTPTLVDAYRLPAVAVPVLRSAIGALLAFWLVAAWPEGEESRPAAIR
jgi:hypothetical protein